MIVRAQIAWWPDSALPRDAVSINPHFENTIGIPGAGDWEQFADDLATAMATYAGNAYQTRVSIYDAEGSAPVFPEAVVTKLPGVHVAARGGALPLVLLREQHAQASRAAVHTDRGTAVDAGAAAGRCPTHEGPRLRHPARERRRRQHRLGRVEPDGCGLPPGHEQLGG